MILRLPILDETTAGDRRSAGEFEFETATLTLREIIRTRVRQEVQKFNEAGHEVFQGLVQPEESEQILNGIRERRRTLDWEKQYAKAIAAFKSNGFLVLVDDRQMLDLDETIHLTPDTRVAFLKLVPLIGG